MHQMLLHWCECLEPPRINELTVSYKRKHPTVNTFFQHYNTLFSFYVHVARYKSNSAYISLIHK